MASAGSRRPTCGTLRFLRQLDSRHTTTALLAVGKRQTPTMGLDYLATQNETDSSPGRLRREEGNKQIVRTRQTDAVVTDLNGHPSLRLIPGNLNGPLLRLP